MCQSCSLIELVVVCSVVKMEMIEGDVDSKVLDCSIVMLISVGTNADVIAFSLIEDAPYSLFNLGVFVTDFVMAVVSVDDDDFD
jgi:hypothetical protein